MVNHIFDYIEEDPVELFTVKVNGVFQVMDIAVDIDSIYIQSLTLVQSIIIEGIRQRVDRILYRE